MKLAEAALRAAQGKRQKFDKTAPWFHTDDLDYALNGLETDESAHIYLPPKKTHFAKTVPPIVLVIVLGLIVVGLVNGCVTVFHLLFH